MVFCGIDIIKIKDRKNIYYGEGIFYKKYY